MGRKWKVKCEGGNFWALDGASGDMKRPRRYVGLSAERFHYVHKVLDIPKIPGVWIPSGPHPQDFLSGGTRWSLLEPDHPISTPPESQGW